MHSLHVINQTAETKEKRRGKRTKKNTESVLLGIYTPHSAGMAACNDASIAFVKSTFFSGVQAFENYSGVNSLMGHGCGSRFFC